MRSRARFPTLAGVHLLWLVVSSDLQVCRDACDVGLDKKPNEEAARSRLVIINGIQTLMFALSYRTWIDVPAHLHPSYQDRKHASTWRLRHPMNHMCNSLIALNLTPAEHLPLMTKQTPRCSHSRADGVPHAVVAICTNLGAWEMLHVQVQPLETFPPISSNRLRIPNQTRIAVALELERLRPLTPDALITYLS
ncbi:hypothetical protein EK21DRAFT_87751 [Setomelanomma holmii]|uniref:Secreted protein n=1 Tax=Setomelanomma holmii TaxID=210430 RepID=A0A9P4LN64_9PLEO|nr:hypothetical protein EK21DRAFT_87751 [Setomelanomma holmii]